MSDTIPLDVVDSILAYLCGTPSILKCALVCKSWVPGARYHLLPPPKRLRLDNIQIFDFIELTYSPESTLLLLSFNQLHLTQGRRSRYVNLKQPEWMDRTAVSYFLEVVTPISPVTSLILDCVNWETLSPKAIASFGTRYMHVKELDVSHVAIDLSEFCALLATFPAMETITLGQDIEISSLEEMDSIEMTHPSLLKVFLSGFPRVWMFRFFAKAIKCTSGIVEITADILRDGDGTQYEACGLMLNAAGPNLQILRLLGPIYLGSRVPIDKEVSLSNFLALPQNPDLRKIEISPVNENTLNSFLRGLKSNIKPNLCHLKLGLKSRTHLRWEATWALADEVLSAIPAKDPKLIVDLPILPPRQWMRLSGRAETEVDTEPEKVLHRMLPRTAERWTIEVQIYSR